MDQSDIHAVSVAVLAHGRFLLVRRGRAPSRGLFAFPGGRVEPGENAEAAARRELFEETGLCAGKMAVLRELIIEGDAGRRYRLEVFRALEVEGVLSAGDDADHAGWYTLEEMRSLPITASTLAVAESIAAVPS
ncbi:NUDIX domain-containing protein [Chelativorans sp.]|uniref:NUDIX hydrolase n=1 Tax=Chelativorans sp. TaxID=2203393 RepID=UPI002812223A|nr:NUDIX domain-containing protein [Chelativorans sp.]